MRVGDFARSAERHDDWPTAAERWGLVLERFPDCVEAQTQMAKALGAMSRREDASN